LGENLEGINVDDADVGKIKGKPLDVRVAEVAEVGRGLSADPSRLVSALSLFDDATVENDLSSTKCAKLSNFFSSD